MHTVLLALTGTSKMSDLLAASARTLLSCAYLHTEAPTSLAPPSGSSAALFTVTPSSPAADAAPCVHGHTRTRSKVGARLGRTHRSRGSARSRETP
jgi:hypothetical protein